VLPALSALISLQQLDSAAEAAQKRLADLPADEAAIETRIQDAAGIVEDARSRLAANQQARRDLEKEVAAVDSRLSRFNDHKAAVKTNVEYTALLHEIATAKGEKDAIEERILVLMEEADGVTADLRAADAALAEATRDGEKQRAGLAEEARTLGADLERLARERAAEAAHIDPSLLAKYDQILRQRRGLAVVPMTGEVCSACFVRLRPHIAQLVRRNDEIVPCESCQRILYFEVPSDQAQAG
jgi:uncharacterized protein